MGWMVVPNLVECRVQMDQRFPGRDRSTDGTIGDEPHAASTSSHNPDITGTPEYRDYDSLNEVRAYDIDKDVNDPGGVTMEDVIQHWVTLARASVGKESQRPPLWHVRYIVYNRRIWHRRDGFQTHAYTGSNTHEDHAHINSDFNQAADTATGTDWRLNELGEVGSDMWCNKGEKGNNVGRLQDRLIEVGIPVGPLSDPNDPNSAPVPIDPNDPYKWSDKDYGGWTSRAVATLKAVPGDNGEAFNSEQDRALRALERAKLGGGVGLVPHTHSVSLSVSTTGGGSGNTGVAVASKP